MKTNWLEKIAKMLDTLPKKLKYRQHFDMCILYAELLDGEAARGHESATALRHTRACAMGWAAKLIPNFPFKITKGGELRLRDKPRDNTSAWFECGPKVLGIPKRVFDSIFFRDFAADDRTYPARVAQKIRRYIKGIKYRQAKKKEIRTMSRRRSL